MEGKNPKMIFDPESFWLGVLVGALVIVLFTAAAYFFLYWDARTALREVVENGVAKPICGCAHHRSFHDNEGCHYIETSAYRENTRCGCKTYIGPAVLADSEPEVLEEKRET